MDRIRRNALAPAAGTLAALVGAAGLAHVVDDPLYRLLDSPRQPLPAPPALVLGIDASDPWPWSSARIAAMLERLRGAGVRGIALDLPLQAAGTQDDLGADAGLARALLDNRVALGVPLARQSAAAPAHARLPPVEFASAARLGHVLLPRDRDGRIRSHVPRELGDDGVRWPSLPLVLVKPGERGGVRDWDAGRRWRISYADGAATPPTLRAGDFMAGAIDTTALHGRWVLVGLTDPSLQARVPGPHGSDALYPVEHHARALVAMLQGDATRPLPAPMQALLALLLAGGAVGAGLARGGRGGRLPLALCAGAATSVALAGGLLARQVWFAPGGTLVVLAAALLAWAVLALRREVRARRRLPGLASRACLETALAACRIAGTPHALVRLDSAASDSVQDCRLAQLLRERARRPGDIAAHLGAGRFVLLLPGTHAQAACRILDDIRQQAPARDLVPPEGRVHACDGDPCTCTAALDAPVPAAGTPVG